MFDSSGAQWGFVTTHSDHTVGTRLTHLIFATILIQSAQAQTQPQTQPTSSFTTLITVHIHAHVGEILGAINETDSEGSSSSSGSCCVFVTSDEGGGANSDGLGKSSSMAAFLSKLSATTTLVDPSRPRGSPKAGRGRKRRGRRASLNLSGFNFNASFTGGSGQSGRRRGRSRRGSTCSVGSTGVSVWIVHVCLEVL